MKFCDKLIQLRKRNGFSQEELGEKLNVTRQTISKWELEQSKPDTDKILAISKLFNIDFNLLVDDNITLEQFNNNEYSSTNNLKKRKWLLIFLIIIVIIIILGGIFIINRVTKEKNSFFDLFNFEEIIDENFGDMKDSINKSSFNSLFEMYIGTEYGSAASWLLDEVITNNKTNSTRLITVKYDDISTTNPTEIKDIKMKFETWNKYEISVEYDEDGYIYLITIEN